MTVDDPLLPQTLDDESALFGCILMNPQAIRFANDLTPADFSNDARQTLFAVMRQLDADGLPCNLLTLITRLERTGQLERVGGASTLSRMIKVMPTPENTLRYIRLVKQAAQDRQTALLADALDSIASERPDPPQTTAYTSEPRRAPRRQLAEPPSPDAARAQISRQAPALQRIGALLSKAFPPTRWIVPDLLPEGLTLLAARPKLGKSWLVLGLALAVASGGLALGQLAAQQGDVLYLALEDSEKRLHARTSQLLAGAPCPATLEVAISWPRLDEGGLHLLDLWLRLHSDARLVILDTFAKIRGRPRASTLYGKDYASLEGVQTLAHQHGVSILVIHHTGKANRADPLDEVNATQGLTGVADNILILRRQRGQDAATLIGDGRELTGIEQTLQFDGATGAWTIAPPTEEPPKTPERAEILALLKANPKPMTPTQVAEHLGKNINTIRTLLTRMARAEEITMVGYGKYTTTVNSVNSVNS